jgi:hypothetical protein
MGDWGLLGRTKLRIYTSHLMIYTRLNFLEPIRHEGEIIMDFDNGFCLRRRRFSLCNNHNHHYHIFFWRGTAESKGEIYAHRSVWGLEHTKHKVIIYLELDHSSSSNGFILYFPPLIMFTIAAAVVSAWRSRPGVDSTGHIISSSQTKPLFYFYFR